MYNRIFLVSNPSSSHAAQVKKEVIDPIHAYVHGEIYDFSVTSKDRRVTAAQIAELVHPGDRVIVAGGDGTGNVVINGLMQASDIDGVTVGFLPYGNFNDMAATFTSKQTKKNPLLLLSDVKKSTVRPLRVEVNNTVYQYALLYATTGWTALAAAEFDKPHKRANLQEKEVSFAVSLIDIAKMYFKTRHTSYLPAFHRENDTKLYTTITDVLCINGPIMAKIIRSQESLYEKPHFLSKDLNVSSFFANTKFLGKSGLNYLLKTHHRLPGTVRTSDVLLFETPAALPLQIDGEVSQLQNVNTLSILKDRSANARIITVLKTTS